MERAQPVERAGDRCATHEVRGGDGLRLHACEWGDRRRPSILLIHGWSQSQLCWRRQIVGSLIDRFHIVTFDIRGHGMSEKPLDRDRYSDPRLWADDLAAIIERTGAERPVLVAWSYGATEAKVPEIVDAIVDVTETGSTLRAHGMRIVETLLESEVLLIANRTAASDPARRKAMQDVATLLLGALRAEGRVLIKLNVAEDRLDELLGFVPAMKSPTVSRLSAGGYAVETVVDKHDVNRLIPLLKEHGAADILELPISKIVP